MLARMLGAATLNKGTFEDVEHDRSATLQAMAVVILVSVASGIGGVLGGEVDILRGVLFGVIRGVLSWGVWAAAALLIGTTILKTPATHADWGEVARGTGFAQTPGLLNVLVFVPVLGEIVRVVTFFWQLAAMLMAVPGKPGLRLFVAGLFRGTDSVDSCTDSERGHLLAAQNLGGLH